MDVNKLLVLLDEDVNVDDVLLGLDDNEKYCVLNLMLVFDKLDGKFELIFNSIDK